MSSAQDGAALAAQGTDGAAGERGVMDAAAASGSSSQASSSVTSATAMLDAAAPAASASAEAAAQSTAGPAAALDSTADAELGSDADAEGEDDDEWAGEGADAEHGVVLSQSGAPEESVAPDAGAVEEFSTPPRSTEPSEGPKPEAEVREPAMTKGPAHEQATAAVETDGSRAEVPAEATAAPSTSTPAAPQASAAPASDAAQAQEAANAAAANFLQQTFDSFDKPGTAQGTLAMAAQADASLAPSEVLRQRIARNRRDGDAWLALIDDAMQRADLANARKVYEEFLQVYPNAARQWQDYAALELQHSEFQNVEAIFTRCLRTTPSTDLWRFYLQYTRRVNPLPPPSKSVNGEDTERDRVRKVIEGAYEFALRFIGQSRDAGDVWRDYIGLLKERETANQWQSGQKMDDIRRTYQRAVAIPLANVEMLWREYDAYENGLNRITAKKFLADRSAAYMTARTAFREMRNLTDSLSRPNIPRVPCWAVAPSLSPEVTPLTVVRDRHQVDAWKKYLRWEEGNPLQLEDASMLQSRVLMAYRKATIHLRFFPEIWYLASQYLVACGRTDEAQAWLKSGLEACEGSSLMCFAYVELAERLSQTEGCGAVFTEHIEWINAEIDRLNTNLADRIKTIDEEAERMKAEAAARRRDEGASEYVEGEEREEVRKMDEAREQRREAEREAARPTIDEMKENASLVWIKYMHFVRRTEGQRPMRAIFGRARKSKYCTWQIFEANALMEYHCSKEVAVATKVFELALKSYGDDEAFVVRYLDFLLSINDDNNARALFERTVKSFSPERARPLWDRWCDYEYSFGDSASIARITERLNEVYPDESLAKRLVDRNSYMDLDVVGPRDLGLRMAGAGGSNAAERAVAASRDMVNDATVMPSHENPAMAAMAATHGPAHSANGNPGPSGPQQPPVKRARFQDETADNSAANTPPNGHAANRPLPTGPRGTKRSVSPPARFVPPPRESSGAQAGPGPAAPGPPSAPSQPAYLELPDGILFFMDALPNASLFDGPHLDPDSILECIARSNVPAPDLSAKIMGGGQNFNNNFQQGGNFRGNRGGFQQRRGFNRGGRRY